MRATPLVYAAGQKVLQDARRIVGEDVAIENLVASAIGAGHVRYGRDPVVRDRAGAWQARVRRGSGQPRPKPRAWFVVGIEPLNKEEL